MVADIDTFISLRRIESRMPGWHFTTVHPPPLPPNHDTIAYGGSLMALSLHAAYQALPDAANGAAPFAPYSMLGHFLGPSLAAHAIDLHVESLRDTRTFATRHVRATQTMDGRVRTCMAVTVDFIVSPPGRRQSVFTYSVQPSERNVTHHSALPTLQEQWRAMQHTVTDAQQRAKIEREVQHHSRGVTYKLPQQGVWAHNMFGLLKQLRTPMDHMATADKKTFDWHRATRTPKCRGANDGDELWPPSQAAAHACQVAFTLDGYMASITATFNHLDRNDFDAASSLDVALRFHTDAFDSAQWHLREIRTTVGGDQRGFDEAKLWRESVTEAGVKEYVLVATVNEATILRGPTSLAHANVKL